MIQLYLKIIMCSQRHIFAAHLYFCFSSFSLAYISVFQLLLYFFLCFQQILSFLNRQYFLSLSHIFSYLFFWISSLLPFFLMHPMPHCYSIHLHFTLFNSLFPFFFVYLYFFIPRWCNILMFYVLSLYCTFSYLYYQSSDRCHLINMSVSDS